MMTEILCYGDSNTFGTVARWQDDAPEHRRYGRETRWPCVLADDLGDGYFVTEDGLPGRTTIYDPLDGNFCNGLSLLLPALLSHRPLDIVILMLGTNDIHLPYKLMEDETGIGISKLIETVQAHPECGSCDKPPHILVIAPPYITPSDPRGRISVYPKFHGTFGENETRRFPIVYKKVADSYGCSFLNAAEYTEPDVADGVHLTAQSHIALGHAVAEKIRQITSQLNTLQQRPL